ncbi:hypothetical protein FACS189472_16930 [Alphaproteobacteria bacterium]|nr:hypothetical protein FACS189472_16930 [Alphaproteobacteria bacterium]
MGNSSFNYTKKDDDEIEIELPQPAEPIMKSEDTLTKLRKELEGELKFINERLEIERIKKHIGMSNEYDHYEKRRNELVIGLNVVH